nr:hypothetical protein CFP56_55162 [Quercus suber]
MRRHQQKRERKRLTGPATIVRDSQHDYDYCVYDSDIATGLGVGAVLFLLASQALIMVSSQCFCCGKPLSPGGSRAWAVILFIICWLFFLIAEICLLVGLARESFQQYVAVFILIHDPAVNPWRDRLSYEHYVAWNLLKDSRCFS